MSLFHFMNNKYLHFSSFKFYLHTYVYKMVRFYGVLIVKIYFTSPPAWKWPIQNFLATKQDNKELHLNNKTWQYLRKTLIIRVKNNNLIWKSTFLLFKVMSSKQTNLFLLQVLADVFLWKTKCATPVLF